MRYFFAVGEPCGDQYGAALMRQLRRRDPDARFSGVGGQLMIEEGCAVVERARPVRTPGSAAALIDWMQSMRTARSCEAAMSSFRPDALILVDQPSWYWGLAQRAHDQGIVVYNFVPPQIWGWSSMQLRRVATLADHILCGLPFEEAWYHSCKIEPVDYVGHPCFDILAQKELDYDFILAHRRRTQRKTVALLPGSKLHEIKDNGPAMVRAVRVLSKHVRDVHVLVALREKEHRRTVDAMVRRLSVPVDVHVGRTSEIIRLADAAVAVSGSVGLELLDQTTPAVILYRLNPLVHHLIRPWLLRSPFISLVNLMAGQIVLPEYLGYRDRSGEIANHLTSWLVDEQTRSCVRAKLARLKELYAAPGACETAAERIISGLCSPPMTVASA